MTDVPQPSSAWRAVVTVALVLAVVSAAVTLWNLYDARNPDYSCSLILQDWKALNVDPDNLGNRAGTWSWWPTGLNCSYPTLDGGVVWVAPEPYLSAALVICLTSVAVVLVGVIVLAALRRRGNHWKDQE